MVSCPIAWANMSLCGSEFPREFIFKCLQAQNALRSLRTKASGPLTLTSDFFSWSNYGESPPERPISGGNPTREEGP